MAGGFVRWGPPEVLTERTVGQMWGIPFDQSTQHIVNRGYHSRSNTIPSDHRRPTVFSREVVETVSEQPYVVRERDEPNPGEVRSDLTYTRYISPRVSDPAFWGEPGGFSSRLANAEDMAVTLARKKLADSNQFNVGVFLAEARASATMLAGTAGELGKGLIAARRWIGSQKTQKAKQAALATSGAWLQGYYGWGSLARDAIDAWDVFFGEHVPKPWLIKSRHTHSFDMDFASNDGWESKSTWTGKVTCGYDARVNDEFKRSLNGMGLLNPAAIAWELSPFSFVVDWAMPIGNALTALTATAGLDFDSGFLSSTRSFDLTRRYLQRFPWEQVQSNGFLHTRVKRFDRKLLGGFLPPRLYANENPFSTNRILSGTALLIQGLFGRAR